MKSALNVGGRLLATTVVAIAILSLIPTFVSAQSADGERVLAESKGAVEKAWKAMQASVGGRLPTLEGFASSGEHPLDRYERGYYQATLQVTALPSGGSRARVVVKVTAWYNDPAGARSGYQLLTSNGRLEADLLDQLSQQIAKSGERPREGSPSEPKVASNPAPESSSPAVPEAPEIKRDFSSSSLSHGLTSPPSTDEHAAEKVDTDKSDGALRAQAQSLEEVLKNQAHPKNLVAVKKFGTPVVSTPSLTAKPLFLASLHDEFEMLDFNQDWVHVRISGLSRGWIWRNSLEMPEGIPETSASAAPAQAPAADLFHVVREETAPFPGTWEPLHGKNVKIISVQKVDDNAKDAGSKERLEYAKFLLGKNYSEVAGKPQELAGIVVIFDSADGGMIAASFATLKEWKAGTLSDSALWHKCFFDPPETFDSAGAAASQ